MLLSKILRDMKKFMTRMIDFVSKVLSIAADVAVIFTAIKVNW